jgi:FkbM family methyltransferase
MIRAGEGMYHLFAWTRKSVSRNELTRHYEPLQPHLLMALASHFGCTTFVDVGSNVGAYALLMSTLPTVTSIHAFEPSPETFAELSANVALNVVNVQLHNKAVSDRPGVLAFGIVNSLSGANSVIDPSLHRGFERTIEVEAVRIDDVLSEEGRRICIKIDVEGHEATALAGMTGLLSRNQIVLQVEDYNSDSDELDSILTPYGLHSLFRIGADRYFSNIKPLLSDRECLTIFEIAAKSLVETNLAALEERYPQGITPISVGLPGNVKLQIGGGLATFARKLRKTIGAQRYEH